MLKFNEYVDKASRAVAAIQYPKQPVGLYEPISYTMSLGGKRLRPVLTLMACDAFWGSCERAIDAAVGIELYHNFTLLHDDVMDKADVRRGKPTVHVKWDENTAILSGDAMLTMAGQYIARTPADVLPRVLEIFNRTAMEVYEGQQYDVDFERRNDVAEAEYIDMIRLKTSVLLGCACKVGAIIGGADDAAADTIYKYGCDLGLAFQLQDDLLDVYGDPETFGKEIGGDIANNKKTYMLINAINSAAGEDARELEKWLADTNPEHRGEKIAAVRGIYDRLGIARKAEEAIARYTWQSLEWLDAAKLDEDACVAFRNFATMLLSRKK